VKDYPMRFSIRDLLWATVVVAMGLGWWLDRNTAEAKAKLMAGHAARLHSALTAAKPLVDAYCVNAATIYTGSPPPKYPDFSPLDEPLIEP
jgi:hypothetical protein